MQGTLSSLFWADRLLELPISLLVISLATASLPDLSLYWGEKNSKAWLIQFWRQTILSVVFLTLAALIMYFGANFIIDLLFNRGKFSANDFERTVLILKFYAFLLIPMGITRIWLNFLFASKRQTFLIMISPILLVFHFLMSRHLVGEHALAGLLIATLITQMLFMISVFLAVPGKLKTTY